MIVYITTNLINGKKYIGKDVKNNPKYLGSGSLLKLDIKEYGKENFKKETLETCNNNVILEEREEYWINFYNAIASDEFYNLRKNIKSWYSETSEIKKQHVRDKISKSNKGKKRSQDCCERMSIAQKGKIKGHYHTQESKDKIGAKNKGRKHTEEELIKMSEAKKGTRFSEEHKLKMSENRKGLPMYNDEWRNKIGQANLGKKRSNETKQKISNIKKGNTYRRKMVMQYDLEDNFIREFDSVLEAAQSLNKKQGAGIAEACSGIRKTMYKFKWKYKLI